MLVLTRKVGHAIVCGDYVCVENNSEDGELFIGPADWTELRAVIDQMVAECGE